VGNIFFLFLFFKKITIIIIFQMVFPSDFFLGGKNLPFFEKKYFGKKIFYHKFLAFWEQKSPKIRFLFQKPPKIITIAYDMT